MKSFIFSISFLAFFAEHHQQQQHYNPASSTTTTRTTTRTSVVGVEAAASFVVHPKIVSRQSFFTTTQLLLSNKNDDIAANPDAILQSDDKNSGYSGSDGYSQTLTRRERRLFRRNPKIIEPGRAWLLYQKTTEEDEANDIESSMGMKSNRFRRLTRPFKNRVKKNYFVGRQPGNLILIRHGASEWYQNSTFTGWANPGLSDTGYREVEHAARLLRESGYDIDVVFTSRLKRAICSTWTILNELEESYLPVFKSWRLNERCYGAVTGMRKADLAAEMGPKIIQKWRGDLHEVPPAMSVTDARWPGNERVYADLTTQQIPRTESLKQCMDRVIPLWKEKIQAELQVGHNVLVVGHDSTLRSLVQQIEGISDDNILDVRIPRGSPIVYTFDKKMNVKKNENQTPVMGQMYGTFLDKPFLLQEALKREEEWKRSVPGYNSTMTRKTRTSSSLERSMAKLQAERELEDWVDEKKIDGDGVDVGGDDNNNNNSKAAEKQQVMLKKEEMPSLTAPSNPILIKSHPCLPEGVNLDGYKLPPRKDPVIVMIRHGKTGHNQLGLFTGWEDVPLAPVGVEEAKLAGQNLKKNGFEFDVVYTSWLSRAIETAWYVMEELDTTWLPIIKSWRLNERMYGDLTGKSKRMVARMVGEKQFKAWRRGYSVKPPELSSFSQDYPGNDKRYVKFLKDLRVSFSESIIRSIEKRKLVLRRKYPKTESLEDCMKRTIPYFKYNIIPESVNKGKRVLIASSENAIRGLLMYLCDIPEDKVAQLEIPNGVPLIFDIKSKCVKLLDDGTGRDPLEIYNFGSGAEYLFECASDEDESCDISMLSDEAMTEISRQSESLKSSSSVEVEEKAPVST